MLYFRRFYLWVVFVKVGSFKCSPIYDGTNIKEIEDSFPFYITRDDQGRLDDDCFYSIKRADGKACICSGQDPESLAVHFFTSIGILNLDVGERLYFMDIE